MRLQSLGVRSHVLFTVVAVVLLGFTLLIIAVEPLIAEALRSEHAEQAELLGNVVATDLALAHSSDETSRVRQQAHIENWSKRLEGICLAIVSAEDTVRIQTSPSASQDPCGEYSEHIVLSPRHEGAQWEGVTGDEQILVVVPLTGSTERLVMVRPVQGIAGKVRVLRTLLLLFMGLAVGLVTLFGYALLTPLIIRPVERISKAIARVRAGDMKSYAQVSGGAELRSLAEAFNGMTKTLEGDRTQITHQLSELKIINERLEKAGEELVRSEKLASVGKLAAGVAHEIGNPISIVLGYLELMERKDATEKEQAEYVERCTEAMNRVNSIIRDLLDFARADFAEDGETRRCNVNTVIQQTLPLLRPQPKFRHVQLETEFTDDELSAAIGPRRLQQVLLNLLMNAADATGKKNDRRIGIRTKRHEGRVSIEVSDNGDGIAADTLPNVFDPFYTTKEPGQGTGLGLSVCYSIITGCGGDIQVISPAGEGARFTLTLPPTTPEAPLED